MTSPGVLDMTLTAGNRSGVGSPQAYVAAVHLEAGCLLKRGDDYRWIDLEGSGGRVGIHNHYIYIYIHYDIYIYISIYIYIYIIRVYIHKNIR